MLCGYHHIYSSTWLKPYLGACFSQVTCSVALVLMGLECLLYPAHNEHSAIMWGCRACAWALTPARTRAKLDPVAMKGINLGRSKGSLGLTWSGSFTNCGPYLTQGVPKFIEIKIWTLSILNRRRLSCQKAVGAACLCMVYAYALECFQLPSFTATPSPKKVRLILACRGRARFWI